LVTIVFADLVGFTGLAERLDPEEVQDLLNSCFNCLVPCVERYGGTIDKFMGDALMALFGAPVAHERDPERAIRAAVDMRSSLDEFNRAQGLKLAVHIGINTGHVLAGSVGSAARQDYSVVGDAVNVASRLMSLSAPNEILIGPRTYALAGFAFESEEAGTLTVRGRKETVRVHRVLGAAPTSQGQMMSQLHAPMVGRERELAVISGALGRLVQGEGGVVYILGEVGLGKSRLLSEAHEVAAHTGVTWLEGRAVSIGQNLSYGPIKQILELDAGLSSDEDPAGRLARLGRRLAGLLPEDHDRHLGPLADLLGLLPEAAGRDRHLSVDQTLVHERLQESLLQYFEGLSTKQPLVLVFEDCHWIDASSSAFLERLLSLTQTTPLLLCLVARPEMEGTLLDPGRVAARLEGRYEEIRLTSLEEDEGRRLVAELLGSHQLPAGLEPMVERQAEGNPFFIQEILRSLIETGRMEVDGEGRWRLTECLVPNLPDTLEALIIARMDRLQEVSKQILRLASVVGDSFAESLVLTLSGIGQAELTRQLQHLENLEVIRSVGTTPHSQYVFVHALIREAVYESLPARERRALHARVAAEIESASVAELDDRNALLAHHYSKAERWDQARDHLLKAADRAGDLGAREASGYYEQALETVFRGYSEDIARAIHGAYIAANSGRLDHDDARLLPWDDLPEAYQESNLRQAGWFPTYLETVGCGFAPAKDARPRRVEFTVEEVEALAQLEHERWWSQKRSKGYVFGSMRSDAEGTHPSMVPWEQLSEEEREKDRQAVRAVPERFAEAGFETYRLSGRES
jgi:class 3 adenylate cyclase